MNASPHEQGLVETTAGYEAMPAVSQDEIAEGLAEHRQQQHEITRRRFLQGMVGLGVGSVGAIALEKLAGPPIRSYTDGHWKPRDTTFHYVNEKRRVKGPNRVAFVIPGFGQMTSYNGAHQQYEAFDGTEQVAWVDMTTRDFDEYSFGDAMWNFIQQKKIDEVIIEGESMGLIVGLMAYRSIYERIQSLIKQERIPAHTTIPTLRMAAGNCSPSDFEDAMSGELTVLLANLADASGYEPDAVGKYLYDLLDGDGDAWRTLDVIDQKQFIAHLQETFRQMENDTSPYTAYAQGKLLRRFDWLQQSVEYVPILNPDMDAVHVEPTGFDPIVNRITAPEKWKAGYYNAGVHRFKMLLDGDSGHADTVRFAQVIAREKFRGAILLDKAA